MKKLVSALCWVVLAGCGKEPINPAPAPVSPQAVSQESPGAVPDGAAETETTSKRPADDQSPPGVPDVAELAKDLASRDPQVRVDAAEQLGLLRLLAKDAILPLIQRLEDEQPYVRGVAATALGQILAVDMIDPTPRDRGPHVDAAVAGLIKALNDKVALVRQMAALSLGEIGPDATAAVPTLTKSLDDADAGVRKAAETALQVITHKFPSSFK